MIRSIRKYLDLSVNDVSFALDLDKQYIRDVESKKTHPQYKLINYYSSKTGIEFANLETILLYSGKNLFKKTVIYCLHSYFKIVLYLKK